MAWSIRTYKLVSERAEPGLFCGNDMLTLGGVPLLRKTNQSMEPRSPEELQKIFDDAYGAESGIDALSRLSCLRAVGKALDNGDLAYATIASLMLRLPDIEAKLSTTKYDPDESRDWRGRWTSGGDHGPDQDASSQDRGLQPIQSHPTGHWPDIHQDNSNIEPTQLVVPFPAPPPIFGGAAGAPKPKDDDEIFPPYIPPAGTGNPANDDANVNTRAISNDNVPRTCPDPNPELDAESRSIPQLQYQAQITGLPLGSEVIFNGVRYDGCRVSDGTLLEAKLAKLWFGNIPYLVFRSFSGYLDTVNQAFRQNYSSEGRKVEWYYSDPLTTAFWGREFKRLGFSNITVKYEPYDGNYKVTKCLIAFF